MGSDLYSITLPDRFLYGLGMPDLCPDKERTAPLPYLRARLKGCLRTSLLKFLRPESLLLTGQPPLAVEKEVN